MPHTKPQLFFSPFGRANLMDVILLVLTFKMIISNIMLLKRFSCRSFTKLPNFTKKLRVGRSNMSSEHLCWPCLLAHELVTKHK